MPDKVIIIWVSFSSHTQDFGLPAFAKSAISGPSLALLRAKYKGRLEKKIKIQRTSKLQF